MYDVKDVSRYIINYSNMMNYNISNLKLQKLLYFIQAYFLINPDYHNPCFNEVIEAWSFGPVVPVAYYEYKEYGGGHIPTIDSYLQFDRNDMWGCNRVIYNKNIIKEKDAMLINEMVDKLSIYTATDLVELTMKQDPWKKAYKRSDKTITNEDLIEYFKF